MSSKISIITVVLNSKENLELTIKSLCNQHFKDFELIIIDGGSTDGTENLIKKYSHVITKYISEKDNGLYDAMNKGINLATGDGLMFLNAGDMLCNQVLTNNIKIPSFIPVFYKNYKNKLIKLKPKFYKLGIPYCHQGIIFENKNFFYSDKYQIASDYDFYLKYKYNDKVKFSETGGYVYYDNSGLSSINYKLRDREIGVIIKKNFGYFWYNLFIVNCFFKNIIKFLIK